MSWPDLDPQLWLDAILKAVDSLPHGVEILLGLVVVAGIRGGLVPLILAIRGRG